MTAVHLDIGHSASLEGHAAIFSNKHQALLSLSQALAPITLAREGGASIKRDGPEFVALKEAITKVQDAYQLDLSFTGNFDSISGPEVSKALIEAERALLVLAMPEVPQNLIEKYKNKFTKLGGDLGKQFAATVAQCMSEMQVNGAVFLQKFQEDIHELTVPLGVLASGKFDGHYLATEESLPMARYFNAPGLQGTQDKLMKYSPGELSIVTEALSACVSPGQFNSARRASSERLLGAVAQSGWYVSEWKVVDARNALEILSSVKQHFSLDEDFNQLYQIMSTLEKLEERRSQDVQEWKISADRIKHIQEARTLGTVPEGLLSRVSGASFEFLAKWQLHKLDAAIKSIDRKYALQETELSALVSKIEERNGRHDVDGGDSNQIYSALVDLLKKKNPEPATTSGAVQIFDQVQKLIDGFDALLAISVSRDRSNELHAASASVSKVLAIWRDKIIPDYVRRESEVLTYADDESRVSQALVIEVLQVQSVYEACKEMREFYFDFENHARDQILTKMGIPPGNNEIPNLDTYTLKAACKVAKADLLNWAGTMFAKALAETSHVSTSETQSPELMQLQVNIEFSGAYAMKALARGGREGLLEQVEFAKSTLKRGQLEIKLPAESLIAYFPANFQMHADFDEPQCKIRLDKDPLQIFANVRLAPLSDRDSDKMQAALDNYAALLKRKFEMHLRLEDGSYPVLKVSAKFEKELA